MRWVPFPDEALAVHGLPWFEENAPDLWRLPKRAEGAVPDAVWNLAHFPGGGRIRFASDTSGLAIRYELSGEGRGPGSLGRRGLDVYVDGVYWSSALADSSGEKPFSISRWYSDRALAPSTAPQHPRQGMLWLGQMAPHPSAVRGPRHSWPFLRRQSFS